MTTQAGNRVFGYCRASTKKQELSPEVQKSTIQSYVAMNQLGFVDAFFVDAATSGKTNMVERTAGRDMMSRVRRGDMIIVAKLDRAFRRFQDCVNILDHLDRVGCGLHICNVAGASMDLASPMGRCILHILAAFAELERKTIGERVRESMAHKAREGKRYCHFAGYGFQWVHVRNGHGKSERVKQPHHGERAVMRKIALWRLQDPPLSWQEIVHILGQRSEVTKEGKPWSVMRVRRAFQAEMWLQAAENKAMVTRPFDPNKTEEGDDE